MVDKVLRLTLPDGVMVCTPHTLDDFTSYVLIEQGDWIEPDIEFVRLYVKPGMRCLDIGANYGIYTTTMAKRVGENGHVWAFEPVSQTFDYLRVSISANGLKNVTPINMALGDKTGTEEMAICRINEGSHIVTYENPNEADFPIETIQITTLDKYYPPTYHGGIDFVKIDVEGYEPYILRGGKEFFTDQNPLVMYEINRGGILNLELMDQFRSLGYDSYQYISAIKCLVPATKNDVSKIGMLDLFACKQDKAKELHDAGYLAFKPEIKKNGSDHNNLTANERYGSILTKWQILCVKVKEKPTRFRMLRLVELAKQLGFKNYAVELLKKMNEAIALEGDGPEQIKSFSKNLKEIEKTSKITSFFLPKESTERICFIRHHGQSDEEMDRRWLLLNKRFGEDVIKNWLTA